MELGKLDRATLKSVLKKILKEDINLFKEVLKEILAENQVISSENQADRRKKIESIINDDFTRYEDVFKALA